VASSNYSLHADNEAFSLARFQGILPAGLVGNTQHFAAERGRLISATYGVGSFDEAALTEVFWVHFDATPNETAYRVFPFIRVVEGIASFDVSVKITTETTAGANSANDTYSMTWRRPLESQWPHGWDELGSVPVTYPVTGTGADDIIAMLRQGYKMFPLGPFKHTPSPALTTQGRVLKVEMQATGTLIIGAVFTNVGVGCAMIGAVGYSA